MKSIHRQISLIQLLAFGLLLGLAGSGLYIGVRFALVSEFDRGLWAKASALTAFTKQDFEGVEWQESLQPPREFSRTNGTDFFEIRAADGTSLMRSATLGTNQLPPAPEESASPQFWNLLLPDGEHGRAVGFAFSPSAQAVDRRPAHVRSRFPRTQGAPLQAHIVAAASRAQLDRALQAILMGEIVVGLGLVVGILVIVTLSLRSGLRPLNVLGERAANIDAQSLELRFSTDQLPEELSPISLRLNDLLSRLQSAFERERRFSSDVAHELRTPIGELRTLIEVALKWPERDSAQVYREGLEIVTQLESIINRLFDLTRCESGTLPLTPECIPVAPFVKEAWAPFARKAAQKCLRTSIDLPSSAVLYLDPVRLRIVLGNLLANAVEYTPAQGVITIQYAEPGNGFRLLVANTVENLEPADLPNLFQRFWRKNESRSDAQHCGLGLSVARSFAEQLGCRLTAEFAAPQTLGLLLSGTTGRGKASPRIPELLT